jgi:hypothetical protein
MNRRLAGYQEKCMSRVVLNCLIVAVLAAPATSVVAATPDDPGKLRKKAVDTCSRNLTKMSGKSLRGQPVDNGATMTLTFDGSELKDKSMVLAATCLFNKKSGKTTIKYLAD